MLHISRNNKNYACLKKEKQRNIFGQVYFSFYVVVQDNVYFHILMNSLTTIGQPFDLNSILIELKSTKILKRKNKYFSLRVFHYV